MPARSEGLSGMPKPLRRLYSRLGATAVSTVSTSVSAPAAQARSISASVRCRFFHTYSWNHSRARDSAIRSIGVIDCVDTQNGMPAAAAAFASAISPSCQTRPATAVGAITSGLGCTWPRIFAA